MFSPQAFWGYDNPQFFSRTRTPWVRIWVRWDYLEPHGGFTDPAANTTPINPSLFGEQTPQWYVTWLDHEIRTAVANGKYVILTLKGIPTWANGNTRASARTDFKEDDPTLAPPDDVSTSGPFAYIVWWLAWRYNAFVTPDRYVTAIEVCNEANHNAEWWPQVFSDGQRYLGWYAAGMMHTARVMTAYTFHTPAVMGPALLDFVSTDPNSRTTPWNQFIDRMFQYFNGAGWRGDTWSVWSHHNYGDIRNQRYGTNSVAYQVREALKVRGWTGLQLDGQPSVWLTEGGYQIRENEQTDPTARTRQRDRVVASWNDMHSRAGINMFANYLTWSSRGFDTGLREEWPYAGDPPTYSPSPPPNNERPVAASWTTLPTTWRP